MEHNKNTGFITKCIAALLVLSFSMTSTAFANMGVQTASHWDAQYGLQIRPDGLYHGKKSHLNRVNGYDSSDFIDVATGYNNTAAFVDKDGNLFTSGNEGKALGIGDVFPWGGLSDAFNHRDNYNNWFNITPDNTTFQSVELSNNKGLALDTNGKLWGWGEDMNTVSDPHGHANFPEDSNLLMSPMEYNIPVDPGASIVDYVVLNNMSGFGHLYNTVGIAIDSNNELYRKPKRSDWIKVDHGLTDTITDIKHTQQLDRSVLFFTDTNKLYGMGENIYNFMGIQDGGDPPHIHGHPNVQHTLGLIAEDVAVASIGGSYSMEMIKTDGSFWWSGWDGANRIAESYSQGKNTSGGELIQRGYSITPAEASRVVDIFPGYQNQWSYFYMDTETYHVENYSNNPYAGESTNNNVSLFGTEMNRYRNSQYEIPVYDANGFNLNTGIHQDTGTEFNRRGVTQTGSRYDSNGFNIRGFDVNGIHSTGNAFDENGYDVDGFNASGVATNGTVKSGGISAQSFAVGHSVPRQSYFKTIVENSTINEAGQTKLGTFIVKNNTKDGFELSIKSDELGALKPSTSSDGEQPIPYSVQMTKTGAIGTGITYSDSFTESELADGSQKILARPGSDVQGGTDATFELFITIDQLQAEAMALAGTYEDTLTLTYQDM